MSSNSNTTTNNEDDKEDVEIVSVDVMDVSKKILEIRSDVPFIKDVMKAHRMALNEGQYNKLEKLVEILGNNGNVSMTILNKIEIVIGKLKSRFGSLLAPIETIDISNDSAAMAKSKTLGTTKNGNSPDASTSAKGSSVASSSSRQLPNVQPSSPSEKSETRAKDTTQPMQPSSSSEKSATTAKDTTQPMQPSSSSENSVTRAKDTTQPMQPSSSSEKSATPGKEATQPKASLSAQEPAVQRDVIRARNPSPSAIPLKSKDSLTSEVSNGVWRQSSSTTDTVTNKSGVSNDRRTISGAPSNSIRRFNRSPSPGSEKNSPLAVSVNKTSVEGPKSSQWSTRTPNGVAAKSATSCDFVRRTRPIVPSDYLRKINPSPPHDSVQDNPLSPKVISSGVSVEASSSRQRLSIPNELTSNSSPSFDFVRRSKPGEADFTRRSNPCNPVRPQTTTIAPDLVRRSHNEPEKEVMPVNSLEEARKKLAALRGDAPLASNSNDPRGRKPNYTSSLAATTQLPKTDKALWPRTADISTAAAGDVPSVSLLSAPTLPVHAPVPSVPNRSASGPITNDRAQAFNLNLNQRQISRVVDSQQSPQLGVPAFVQGKTYAITTVSPAADAPPLNGGSPNNPTEIRRDPRWPGKYFSDSRNQNNNYKNDYNKATWNSNGHGNGPNLIQIHPPSRVGTNRLNDQVHTTYREHREAKARAEAAEAAEQQRQFSVDLKRQQEAEKKRQSTSVQKQRELEGIKEKTPEVPTSAPVTGLHLDTSYRNCDQVGAPPKKIVYRIPKITTTVPEHSKDIPKDSQKTKDKTRLLKGNDVAGTSDKKSPAKNSESPDKQIVDLESEPPSASSLTEEVTSKDVNQDKREHKSNKSEKSSDKTKKHRKHRSSSESGKHGKKDRSERKHKEKDKKLTTKIKIVGLTGPSPQTKVVINPDSTQERESIDGEREAIINGNEVKKDEAPIKKSRIKRRNTIAQMLIDDDNDEPLTQTNKKDTTTPDNKTDNVQRIQVSEVIDQPVESPPKRIRKRRNTIAPIAIDRVGDDPPNEPTDKCSISIQNIVMGTRRTQESEVKNQPPPAKPARIVKRRNTMAPIASEPLIDKRELFNNCSLLYEDMQECQRVASDKGIQLSRSVANLFEKTSDNCSVSTQNIIAGKRRKRGDDVSFNETLLSRNCFKLGPIAKPAPKSKLNSNENLAAEVTSAESAAGNNIIKSPPKRKRGRTSTKKPAKKPSLDLPNNSTNVAENQKDKPATDEAPTTSQSANVQPRKPRRPKRNELEKLNEDIAQMYCAEEVMRASGRRTCTQQPLHLLTDDDTISEPNDPNRIRNVARRGVPFSRGPNSTSDGCNRASFSIKQLRVRLRRFSKLEMLNHFSKKLIHQNEASVDEPIKESSRNRGILNTNPDWHALSSVINQCVICDKPIKKYNSVHHYVQHHGEPFGSRFAPGMLNELRMNRGNRPVYCLRQISSSSKTMLRYRYTCPFCKRTADLSTSDWYDHLAQHTGEMRYQCSKCQKQFHRRCAGQQHFKSCSSDAYLIHNESYTNRAPIIVYVCQLCEFVQKSRKNLVKHLKNQHGMNEEESNDKVKSALETIQIYHLEDVAKASSKNVDSPKKKNKPLSIKLPVISKKIQTKKGKKIPKKRFRLMAKKAIKLIKTERSINGSNENVLSNESLMDSQEINNDTPMPMVMIQAHQIVNEPLVEDIEDITDNAFMETLNGRENGEELILPDPEPSFVINECKLEDNQECIEEPQKETDEKIIFLDPNCEKPEESSSPSKKFKIMDFVEITDDEGDNLSGIGSDADDDNPNKKENTVTCNSKSQEKDEWVDLKKSKNTKPKSIFGRFNRFCTRLKKNGEGNVRTKSPKCIGGSPSNKSNDLPLSDHGELMPKMTALDPPALDTALDLETTPAAPPPLFMAPPTRVENVGFRRGSYFCFFPKCTFLYSNEVEGLENHFALEHPSVRWSGKCLACGQYQPDSNSNWTIAQELSHMVENHMEKPPASFAEENEIEQSVPQLVETQTKSLKAQLLERQSLEPQPSPPKSLEPQALEPQPPAPQPPAPPKLRVRRFSGDRLVPVVERESHISKVNNNTMLKDLLNSSPRPPNQQIDFQAAGLGEFLTTKNISQPEPVLVNNHASGLSLSINQVFSLVQNSNPPQHTGDFIVTQSCLGKNLDHRTPAQINISIKPAAPAIPVSVPVSASGLGPAGVPSGVVADRFRCMAPKCGFCAHTVMCIREHMKFHRFSFGNNDYLKCAYCSHIGVNVNDYVHHGVTVHGLASVNELESERADSITTNGAAAAAPPAMETPTASLSVTDQIREVLNQRNQQSFSPSATASPTLSVASSMSTASVNSSVVSIPTSAASKVITELLQFTGHGADKLYACPYKGCSGSLDAKSFVSHIRYHLAIDHTQDADVKCKHCSIRMMPAELLNHLPRFHGRHTVFCAICLATTLNRRVMHTHVKSKHEASFVLANRQLHFLPLSCENVGDTIELAAIEHPFGKSQLENFHRRLNIEWQNRRQNTKVTYLHSEVRLLPKMSVFPNYLKCGDCNKYESRERKALQMHLYAHKASEIAEAYQLGKALVPGTPTTGQELPLSSAPSNSNPNPNIPPVDTVTHLQKQQNLIGEPPKPGQQQIVLPKLIFVPPEKLYHCGSSKCSQLAMPTELALRHHLSRDHSYKDLLSCVHCKYRISHKSMADTLIEHLEMHKQYIYQCGGCSRYGNKRAAIDRHIQERHQDSDVDVIIYKRDKIGVGMSAAKWFKTPKAPIPDFICNLCQHGQDTLPEMMAHILAVHKKQTQYFCPYCLDAFIDPLFMIRHLLMRHPAQPVEPVQVFQRFSVKNRNTLGFYCLKCKEVFNTRQKISSHCETVHQFKHQFKCPHCDFGHSAERNIANHMFEKHPFSSGRAIMQFERVSNYVPDDICWTHLARDFEYEPSTAARHQLQQTQQQKQQTQQQKQQTQQQQNQTQQQQPMVVDEVELISSDEETPIEKSDHLKSIEFACSHCDETSNDVVQLRLDHWATTHGDQPFYFRVQPQLLCAKCKDFRGNAKTLLEKHLTKVHGINETVACDIRRPEECAYCNYQYTSFNDLVQHIHNVGHRANDLKNISDDEFMTLRHFGTDGTTTTTNEYYQCVICKLIMPTCLAMGQHGRTHHPTNFCFRRLTEEVIYHCFVCVFASTDEKETLRHILDHYPKFQQCQFCHGGAEPTPGLDGYIQHRAKHSYADLRKFLMEIHYQFQNGLLITKSSLIRTKFSDESLMKALDNELMRRTTSTGSPCQPFAKRRKTACADGPTGGSAIIAINGEPLRVLTGLQITPINTNTAFITSFTGRDTSSAPSTAASASSTAAAPRNPPPRVLKRRFTVVGDNLNPPFQSKDI